MQRIAVGILILCLIALCGILLVESAGNDAAPPSDGAADRMLKFTIGGDSAGPDADSSHEKVAHAAEKDEAASRTSTSGKAKPWRAPDPVLRHKVAKGDNPMKIAAEYFGVGTNELVDRILKANNLKSAKDLKIDSVLKIPVDHFDSFIADGRYSVRAVAKRIYKSETMLSPLRHANPNLPREPDSLIPIGFTVFIPR